MGKEAKLRKRRTTILCTQIITNYLAYIYLGILWKENKRIRHEKSEASCDQPFPGGNPVVHNY